MYTHLYKLYCNNDAYKIYKYLSLVRVVCTFFFGCVMFGLLARRRTEYGMCEYSFYNRRCLASSISLCLSLFFCLAHQDQGTQILISLCIVVRRFVVTNVDFLDIFTNNNTQANLPYSSFSFSLSLSLTLSITLFNQVDKHHNWIAWFCDIFCCCCCCCHCRFYRWCHTQASTHSIRKTAKKMVFIHWFTLSTDIRCWNRTKLLHFTNYNCITNILSKWLTYDNVCKLFYSRLWKQKWNGIFHFRIFIACTYVRKCVCVMIDICGGSMWFDTANKTTTTNNEYTIFTQNIFICIK